MEVQIWLPRMVEVELGFSEGRLSRCIMRYCSSIFPKTGPEKGLQKGVLHKSGFDFQVDCLELCMHIPLII